MIVYQSRRFLAVFILIFLLTACGSFGGSQSGTVNEPTPGATIPKATLTPTHPPSTPTATPTSSTVDVCPTGRSGCMTPHELRLAYGLDSLIQQGFTGKGQTIIDIVSFGSPTLQQDMDVFDKQFGLPPITLQIISPIGTKPFDQGNKDMVGWAAETTLDVQIIHAIAPDAGIVVLTSPVSETEGTIGLPEFLQLEQYAIDHNLGKIVSQSWGASEVTLKDAAGQAEIQKWDAFYKNATNQLGMTYLSSSGDNGPTDYSDLNATVLSTTPTTSFAPDDPWVTSVGGTTLTRTGSTFQESVWNSNGGASGGGFSSFFPMPDYQKTLPASTQAQFNNRRGVPDVSADADPNTGLAFYMNGVWDQAGGTSASAPLWAGIMAIADQMAGHPLGFINPGLYKLAASSTYSQDFHDITTGNNTDNGLPGYDAVPGWDAATGLGTPNAEKLIPDLIAALK